MNHELMDRQRMQWIVQIVRHALAQWGYFALAAGLLGEDAGVPLPGETLLMLSSFLSHKTHTLFMAPVILIEIAAATLGDNLGFLAGWRLGSERRGACADR